MAVRRPSPTATRRYSGSKNVIAVRGPRNGVSSFVRTLFGSARSVHGRELKALMPIDAAKRPSSPTLMLGLSSSMPVSRVQTMSTRSPGAAVGHPAHVDRVVGQP